MTFSYDPLFTSQSIYVYILLSPILIALHSLCYLLTCRHLVKSIMYRISSIKLCNDDVLYCTVVMNLGGSGT